MDTQAVRRQRLRQLIDERFAGNQSALARAVDRQPDYISRCLKGTKGIGEAFARDIEQRLGLPHLWLDCLPNTEAGPDVAGLVPLISWVQAGHWAEVVDHFAPGDAQEWLPCPVKHSPKTFVLRVRGESMYNPHGRPSFQDGDLIFVDPERPAVHGSLVVVRLDESKEATFKKLIVEGENRYLKALNPAWPEPIVRLDQDATICGVVIFKGEQL
ncbi:MAG: hypothetical protein N2690_11480 [Rhodocyclaceae bacterium]|nr:hypothetical protein [Rhodocyclaceae bacterium]